MSVAYWHMAAYNNTDAPKNKIKGFITSVETNVRTAKIVCRKNYKICMMGLKNGTQDK